MQPNGGERDEGPLGSRFLGVWIGLVVFAVFAALPFLVPALFYVVANVYALTKGTSFSGESVNEDVLLTLLVLSVAAFPLALSALVALIGRALSPKRRAS